MQNNNFLHKDLTNKIIAAFYTVYNDLGYGFLEKVYEEAMKLELSSMRLTTISQMPIDVYYRGDIIGNYFADLCVENSVIIEIKAAQSLADIHEAQLLNYLKATDMEIGLLMNFGPEAKFIRKIMTNDKKRKGHRFTRI